MIQKFPVLKGLLYTLSWLGAHTVLEGRWVRNQYGLTMPSQTPEAHRDLTRM